MKWLATLSALFLMFALALGPMACGRDEGEPKATPLTKSTPAQSVPKTQVPATDREIDITFEFDKVDAGDRAVAFHSIEFIDAEARAIGTLIFGTQEANELQGDGWFENDNASDIGSFQWAGGDSQRADMRLPIPQGTKGLLLRMKSIAPELWMDVRVDGELATILRIGDDWRTGYVPLSEVVPAPVPTEEPEWIEGRYFPLFPSTDRVYAIRVRSELEDYHGEPRSSEWRIDSSYDTMMALTLVGMQGVINRNGPRVYLDWSDQDTDANSHFWIPLLERHVEVVYLDLDGLSAVDFLYRRYGSCFSGAVIYDPDVPDTINLATMLAGLENRIILAPEQVGLPGIPSFDSVTDLQVLANEQGWDASQDAQYRLYEWVYYNLWPDLEHRIVGAISPGPPTSGQHWDTPDTFFPLGMAARDYIVALRLTALWLDPRNESQKELLSRFLDDAPSPIPFFGSSPEEVSTVKLVSRYGDWVPNITNPAASPLSVGGLTVLSGVRPELSRYVADIDIDRLFATLGDRPVATVFSSDGDAVQVIMDRGFHGLINFVWEEVQGHRFGWTFNPSLVDFAPLVWNYYVDSRSEVSLVSGLSGTGYMYPALMTDAQLEAYLSHTAGYLNDTGLRAVRVDERTGAFDDRMAALYYEELRDTGYLGVIAGFGAWPWGLGFEYAGTPAPIVRPAYTLDSTNSGSIIDHLLARESGDITVNIGSDQYSHGGRVIQDKDALGGEAVLISREFIDSPSCCLAASTPDMVLPPGDYSVRFRLKVRDRQDPEPIARVYVGHRFAYPDWEIIATRDVSPSDFAEAGQYQDFTLSFTLNRTATDVQFRIDYLGGSTDLYADSIMASREDSLDLPVFAAVFIGLCIEPQRLTEAPGFAGKFEARGGLVLSPDEFLAALNPEFMIEWAGQILGSDHAALAEAEDQLIAGDYLTSLLTVRDALRTLPERVYLLQDEDLIIRANTLITDIAFDQNTGRIYLQTHGPPNGTVQASITIPDELLIEPFQVNIDSRPHYFMISPDETRNTLTFEFAQGSHRIEIVGQ